MGVPGDDRSVWSDLNLRRTPTIAIVRLEKAREHENSFIELRERRSRGVGTGVTDIILLTLGGVPANHTANISTTLADWSLSSYVIVTQLGSPMTRVRSSS